MRVKVTLQSWRKAEVILQRCMKVKQTLQRERKDKWKIKEL